MNNIIDNRSKEKRKVPTTLPFYTYNEKTGDIVMYHKQNQDMTKDCLPVYSTIINNYDSKTKFYHNMSQATNMLDKDEEIIDIDFVIKNWSGSK